MSERVRFGRPNVEPTVRTADLFDAYGDTLEVVEGTFRSYGGRAWAAGPIRTVQTYGDNARVKEILGEAGEGGVLVVDGGASLRWALLGDRLAAMAVDNGWTGVIVNGCIRDSEIIGGMDLGVWALGTTPRKTTKRGQGLVDLDVRFASVTFRPGWHVVADEDGIVVSERRLATDS